MKRILITLILVTFASAASATGNFQRLSMKHPTHEQVAILTDVLGKDFVKGTDGAMTPELLVSSVDINHDGQPDLIAVQKGECSNHACDFQILFNNQKGSTFLKGWKQIVYFESWSTPYLEPNDDQPDSIIIFEHRSDDCMACSPPTPIRYKWSTEEESYVDAGPVKGKKLQQY